MADKIYRATRQVPLPIPDNVPEAKQQPQKPSFTSTKHVRFIITAKNSNSWADDLYIRERYSSKIRVYS